MSAQGSIRRTSLPGGLDRRATVWAVVASILIVVALAELPREFAAALVREVRTQAVASPSGQDSGGPINQSDGRGMTGLASPSSQASAIGSSAAAVPALLTRPDEGDRPPYLSAIGAGVSWARSGAAPSVLVAVVDSGVDVTHPDLVGHLWENPQWQAEASGALRDDATDCAAARYGCTFVSPETAADSCGYRPGRPSGEITDDNGHGTFVAGVVMAAARTGAGATNQAVDVRILPVKVLDCAGDGRASQAAAGIRYAARSGARVIVLAFSGTSDVPALRDAVAEARRTYGAVVVAAAGNDSGVVMQFPSGYPDVLGVGGTGIASADGGWVDYGSLAPFSNLSDSVRVLAPAVAIEGPVPRALCGQRDWTCTSAEPHAFASGTSYATPLVAGALAMLLAYDPALTPDEATRLLVDSASPVHGSAVGQVDVSAALALARSWREGDHPGWSASGDGIE